MRKMVFAFVLTFLIVNVVQGQYFSIGHGTCGKQLEDYNNSRSTIELKAWALGYITGRNYPDKRKIDNMSGDTNDIASSIFYAIIKYCRENPLKSTQHAMEHIYNNELD